MSPYENPFARRCWRQSRKNPSYLWVKVGDDLYTVGPHKRASTFWLRLPDGSFSTETFFSIESAQDYLAEQHEEKGIAEREAGSALLQKLQARARAS